MAIGGSVKSHYPIEMKRKKVHKISEAIKSGMDAKEAATAFGVTYSTYRIWLREAIGGEIQACDRIPKKVLLAAQAAQGRVVHKSLCIQKIQTERRAACNPRRLLQAFHLTSFRWGSVNCEKCKALLHQADAQK